jgi:hypothetical protein
MFCILKAKNPHPENKVWIATDKLNAGFAA